MSNVDYEKLLKFVLAYIAEVEGTDFLDGKGNQESHSELTDDENAALTRSRDEVRASIGWSGY